jgi:hypothetical protein
LAVFSRLLPGIAALAALLTAASFSSGAAADDDDNQPQFPTTEFAEGASAASVTVGDVTATVQTNRKAKADPAGDLISLRVTVGGRKVAEASGPDAGFDPPEAEASIAEMDPGNGHPEVYFTTYSGGAHCCSTVVVAEELADKKWATVEIGEFDGGGDYLDDVDGDGLAEIVTVDNRFLYQFDCYACSAAPLTMTTVRNGAPIDVTTDPRFLSAHREWLKEIEDTVDPADRWRSPGFLAGWVAEKIRVGEGAAAWNELKAHWDLKNDEGEEVCLTGAEVEDCAKDQIKVMKFPDRLKLFLDRNGYKF